MHEDYCSAVLGEPVNGQLFKRNLAAFCGSRFDSNLASLLSSLRADAMARRDLVGATFGEFAIKAELGHGGHGTVYLATQRPLMREVALKVVSVRTGNDNELAARFMREAQLTAEIIHPYAPTMYSMGIEPDGTRWMAMELVRGVSFEKWLRDNGPMSLEQAVMFFERLAEVLGEIHKRGVVHRDIKPANIMIVGNLIPKLLDYGVAVVPDPEPAVCAQGSLGEGVNEVAKAAAWAASTNDDPGAERLTPRGAAIGSWAFMAPEQWRSSRDVTMRADIYALGILLYISLTGTAPFEGERARDFRDAHTYRPVPALDGRFPAELNRVIARAMAKSPDARYGTARALAADLRNVFASTQRELLRDMVKVWDSWKQPTALLLRGRALEGLAELTNAAEGSDLSRLERSFLVKSKRSRRLTRGAAIMIAAFLFALFVGYRARATTKLAETVFTQAEVEQGRAALIVGSPDATTHLAEAYHRDPVPSTAFMYARSLQSQRSILARMSSIGGRMWSAEFSPGGDRLVTSDDRGVQIREGATGRVLTTLTHGEIVYAATFISAGQQLVTAGGDGTVRLWETATGTLLRTFVARSEQGRPRRYLRLAISPDERLATAIDFNGRFADIWEIATGVVVKEVSVHAAGFPRVAFSMDGRWFAVTGGVDVHLFDTRSWARVAEIRLPGVRGLAFRPGTTQLATVTSTGDLSFWSVRSGARIRQLRDSGEPFEAIAYSRDGQRLATGAQDGQAQVWDATSGKLLSQFNARQAKVMSVEFDGTGRNLLVAGADGSVIIGDTLVGIPLGVLEGPPSKVWSAHFDSDSRRVVAAFWDGSAMVWNAASAYRVWSAAPRASDCGIVTTPEPLGRFVAIGCGDLPTQIWDTEQAHMMAELPAVTRIDADFTSAFPAISRMGNRAAIVRGNTVDVYDLPGGRLHRRVHHEAAVNSVALSDDGQSVVSGDIAGTAKLTEDEGRGLRVAGTDGIDAVLLLPDHRLVIADARSRIRVFDSKGTLLAELAMAGRAMSLRAQANRLVTVPRNGGKISAPMLVDLSSNRVIGELRGHTGRVFAARWISGERLLTAGADGNVRLWSGASGQLLRVFDGGARLVSDVALYQDRFVVGAGADGRLRFWDLESGRSLWTLQAHKSQLVGVSTFGDRLVTRGIAGEVAGWQFPHSDEVIRACDGLKR